MEGGSSENVSPKWNFKIPEIYSMVVPIPYNSLTNFRKPEPFRQSIVKFEIVAFCTIYELVIAESTDALLAGGQKK
jgi:hypothetical protein